MNQFSMKQLLVFIFIFINLSYVNMNKMNNNTLFPNLSVGEYRADIKGIYKCNTVGSNKIQFNLYLNKTSATTSVMKGKFQNTIPFDDTLFVNYNFDIRDTIGGWKDNTIIVIKEKACSTLLSFINKKHMSEFGLRGTCPEPVGVHIMPGVEANNFAKKLLNMPDIFPYGTYKLRISFTDKNKEFIGCITLLLEVKRPWEL